MTESFYEDSDARHLAPDSRMHFSATLRVVLSWVGPIAGFFILWEIVTRSGLANQLLLSPPSTIFRDVATYFVSGEIYPHIGASLMRGLTGFSIAASAGISLGLLLGSNRVLYRLTSPVAELLRQIPPLAMFPVFMITFGIGFQAQLAMVTWAALWQILLNSISGAEGVDQRLVKAARSLGVGRAQLFFKVVLPASLPAIATGLRLGATSSLTVLVAAEMIGANEGLGYLILFNQYSFRISEMYATILVLAALGVTLNYGILFLEARLVPWKGRA